MKGNITLVLILFFSTILFSCTPKEEVKNILPASTASEGEPQPSDNAVSLKNDGKTPFTWEQIEALFKYEKENNLRLVKMTQKKWERIMAAYNNNALKHVKLRKYATPELIRALEIIPRPYLAYNYETDKDRFLGTTGFKSIIDLGWGSTMSATSIQAFMTANAEPKPDDVALEIGTGSGMQSSILSRMVKKVYSIEIREKLAKRVHKTVKLLGYNNIEFKIGDGYYGWKEKGPFDIIIVTCQANHVPPELIKQLKPNGRLIIPVGPAWSRKQQLLKVWKDPETGKVKSKRLMASTLFIPMLGENEKKKAVVKKKAVKKEEAKK
jgi:protein-L-isoaspartate(D-aspartate) O-methyltransferase